MDFIFGLYLFFCTLVTNTASILPIWLSLKMLRAHAVKSQTEYELEKMVNNFWAKSLWGWFTKITFLHLISTYYTIHFPARKLTGSPRKSGPQITLHSCERCMADENYFQTPWSFLFRLFYPYLTLLFVSTGMSRWIIQSNR